MLINLQLNEFNQKKIKMTLFRMSEENLPSEKGTPVVKKGGILTSNNCFKKTNKWQEIGLRCKKIVQYVLRQKYQERQK